LAYADLSKFDFTKVVQRNGRYVVQDTRQKSGEDFYIVLLSPALEILRKYNFELPSISNQQYNLRLKVVADKAGMDKKLTTHMARHSFACFALNAGMPIEVVSKALGHTNINTTQVYAKLLNSTLEREFDKLEGHI
jgi:integrase